MIQFQDTPLKTFPSTLLGKWKIKLDTATKGHRQCYESEFELIDNGKN